MRATHIAIHLLCVTALASKGARAQSSSPAAGPVTTMSFTMSAQQVVDQQVVFGFDRLPYASSLATGVSAQTATGGLKNSSSAGKARKQGPESSPAKVQPSPASLLAQAKDRGQGGQSPDLPAQIDAPALYTSDRAQGEPAQKMLSVLMSEKREQTATQPEDLRISVDQAGQLKLSAHQVRLSEVGSLLALDWDEAVPRDEVSVFVRNPQKASLSDQGQDLLAVEAGSTEVYFVWRGQMHVLGVAISSAETHLAYEDAKEKPSLRDETAALAGLELPYVLTDLTAGGLSWPETAGMHGSAYGSSGQMRTADASGGAVAYAEARSGAYSVARSPESFAQGSQAPGEPESSEGSTQPSLWSGKSQTLERLANPDKPSTFYSAVSLRFQDERRYRHQKASYGAGGLEVRVVGTDFVGTTDATGRITLPEMASDAHYLVRYTDATGKIEPGVFELSVSDALSTQSKKAAAAEVDVPVVRSMSYEHYLTMAHVSQDATLGSLCGEIHPEDRPSSQQDDVQIALNVLADGPFYFNELNVLDETLEKMSASGRFCFFNVDPGPVNLMLQFDGQAGELAHVTVPVFAGRHVEDSFDFRPKQVRPPGLDPADDRPLQEQRKTPRVPALVAGIAPAAYSFVQSEARVDELRLFEDVQMESLAEGEVIVSNEHATLELQSQVTAHKQRMHVFTDDSDFEEALYQVGLVSGAASDSITTLPLLPRGFVEDLAYLNDVAYDPVLGRVFVQHLSGGSPDHAAGSVRLLDVEGREVGRKVLVAHQDSLSAMFFNLAPGSYSVQLETPDGYALTARTLHVYFDTLSVLRTGQEYSLTDLAPSS